MVLWCHQTFSHCIKSLHSLICNAYQNDLKFYFWWKNDQFLVFCNSVSSMWHAKARMCKLISYSHVLQCFTSYNSILLFEFYDDICKSIFAVHHCRWPSGIPGLRVHTDLDIHRIDQTRGAYESTLCMNIHETNVRMMDVKSTSHQANETISISSSTMQHDDLAIIFLSYSWYYCIIVHFFDNCMNMNV